MLALTDADGPGRRAAGVPVLAIVEVIGRAALAVRSRPTTSTCRASRADADALIVYTSGTTGRPKGAVHTHASLLAGVDALVRAWDWQTDDRLLLALPLFHVHGLCAGLFGTLAAGASAVVFDRFDEEAIVARGRRSGDDDVLRRAHDVPPLGRVRAVPAASPRCASACAARPPWPPSCGTTCAARASRCWSATA